MASKNINPSTLGKQLKAAGQKLMSYLGLIVVIVILGMYSFLVFRINNLTTAEPPEDAIAEKLKTVQRPKIDQQVVERVQSLEDNSVEVKALFQEARDNPFSE
jgi:hypothetical protein